MSGNGESTSVSSPYLNPRNTPYKRGIYPQLHSLHFDTSPKANFSAYFNKWGNPPDVTPDLLKYYHLTSKNCRLIQKFRPQTELANFDLLKKQKTSWMNRDD